MSDFNLLSVQRPDEEMLELMAGYVAGWWNDHKEQIMALKNVFNESCTMDQLGFIHDKASGAVIAASKIEWFNKMLEQEDIWVMPENGYTRYTPERDCKYCGERDCILKSKHRNLNRCKICLYGKRR